MPFPRTLPIVTTFLFATSAAATPPDVHTAFGGTILGYDIDASGALGILSEYVPHEDGTNQVAVETFDQTTGQIVKIVRQADETRNDFVVLGVVGSGTGLVEEEFTSDIFVDRRAYHSMTPLSGGKFTQKWTPPLGTKDIIAGVSQNQGSNTTAILYFHNGGKDLTYVLPTDVTTNISGPAIKITDPEFAFSNSPVIAYDPPTNQAIIGSSRGCPDCLARFALVNLSTGQVRQASDPGFGFVNGIAIDSADTIVCTATEIDFHVEFYNFVTGAGKRVLLPGATSQANSGTSVVYDSTNKLFLVAQPISSTAPNSSIQIFNPAGDFVKSVNGLHLPESAARLAINPATRTGFVVSSQAGDTLQAFSY